MSRAVEITQARMEQIRARALERKAIIEKNYPEHAEMLRIVREDWGFEDARIIDFKSPELDFTAKGWEFARNPGVRGDELALWEEQRFRMESAALEAKGRFK